MNGYYLIYSFEESLEINELMEVHKEEKAFRDAADHIMHSIVDMSKVIRFPPNWLVAKAGPVSSHPRSRRIYFVGISYGLQTILKIVRYKRMQFFESREEVDEAMAELVQQAQISEGTTIRGT